MDIIKLIIGLFFVVSGCSYLIIKANKKLNDLNDENKKDYLKIGNQFTMTLGIVIIILIGILLIFQEVTYLF